MLRGSQHLYSTKLFYLGLLATKVKKLELLKRLREEEDMFVKMKFDYTFFFFINLTIFYAVREKRVDQIYQTSSFSKFDF